MSNPTQNKTLTKIAPLWGVEEVSEFLGVPVQTLYLWRSKRIGPAAARVGKHLRYDPDDVVAWFRQQKEAA